MPGDRRVEFSFLLGIRQLALEQQIRDFEKIRFFRQLLNRVAAVQKHARVAINIGQAGQARAGSAKARIKGEHSAFAVEIADVDDLWANAARYGRQGKAVTCVIIVQ